MVKELCVHCMHTHLKSLCCICKVPAPNTKISSVTSHYLVDLWPERRYQPNKSIQLAEDQNSSCRRFSITNRKIPSIPVRMECIHGTGSYAQALREALLTIEPEPSLHGDAAYK